MLKIWKLVQEYGNVSQDICVSIMSISDLLMSAHNGKSVVIKIYVLCLWFYKVKDH